MCKKRSRRTLRGKCSVSPFIQPPPFYFRYRQSPEWASWLSKINNFIKTSSKPQLITLSSGNFVDSRPKFPIRIGHVDVLGLVDTGANRSILGQSAWDKLSSLFSNFLQSSSLSVSTADGRFHNILGEICLPFIGCSREGSFSFLVVPSIQTPLILGVDFCTRFQLKLDFAEHPARIETLNTIEVPEHLTPNDFERLQPIIDKFKNLSLLPRSRTSIVTHHIDTGTSLPFRQRQYPLSPAMMRHLNSELDSMLSDGVVEPSTSPYCSPVLLVKKKSGEYRFCFDGRRLNSVTVRDAYPLPRVDYILDRLRDCKFISTIDLKSAFWQISLSSESKPKTAFAVPGRGLFQFTVLPFGLADSSKTMQRVLDTVFGPELTPYVFGYIDDVVLISETFEQHLNLLNEVYDRLVRANLIVNFDKCHFCKPSLKYLGYIVSQEGLSTDPEKVAAVADFPRPATVTQIKRFVGLVGWYRRFIPDFSTLTAPITALMQGKRKSNPIEWTSDAEASFNEIKKRLSSAPVMAAPDFAREFIVQTDASNTGVGAVLSQVIDGVERPIAYASKTLTKTQRNYTVTERECLSAVWAVDHFRPYIEGTHFVLFSDHASLLWLRNLKDPVGRLARWAMKLSQYDFDLSHRPGKLNVVADALSRTEVAVVDVSLPVSDKWYTRIESGVTQCPERYPLFQLRDGRLYHHSRTQPEPVTNVDPWKLVLPSKYRSEALAECHDLPTASHLGINKTYNRLADLYYWPGMKRDALLYVSRCRVCAAHKVDNKQPAGTMGIMKKVCYPFQMLAIDFLGPLPRSTSGNQYILVVVDVFTKYVFLKPFSRATSKKVIKYLEDEIFLVFGVPQTIVCDNGSQFISKEFKAFAERYKVRNIFYNARYFPQNNPAERVNRVVITALSSYLHENHRLWDVNLPKIAQALRLAKHDATGNSPAFLNFGRMVPLSGNYYGTFDPEKDPLEISPSTNYVEDLKKFNATYKKVTENLKRAYVRSAQYYNLRRREVQYAVGDRVWKRTFPQSNAAVHFSAKLAPKFIPCIVTKKIGSATYQLKDLNNQDLGVWHVQHLKPDLSSFNDDDEVTERPDTNGQQE